MFVSYNQGFCWLLVQILLVFHFKSFVIVTKRCLMLATFSGTVIVAYMVYEACGVLSAASNWPG